MRALMVCVVMLASMPRMPGLRESGRMRNMDILRQEEMKTFLSAQVTSGQ